MGCTICSAQFACSFHNRAEGVIGVQFVVGSIPHAGVFHDEVARGVDCSNPIGCSFSCGAPNRVGFNSVPITPVNGDSTVHIPLDAVSLKGIPVTLTLRANKINPPARVVTNRAIRHGVPVALALVAMKIDATSSIPADGAIGNGVPVALARIPAIKKDAIVSVVGKDHLLNPAVVHILAV